MKIQTSKLILIVDFAVAIVLTAVGFYYWKSKNENRSKYAMKLVKDLAEKYGIENVVSLAEVILKD